MGTTGACFRPDGSRDAAGAAISVNKSGAVWSDTVDGAAAWRVVEGTTNLVLNPLAGTNLAGIATVGATSHTRRTDLTWTHPETGQSVTTGVEMVSATSNFGAFTTASISVPAGTAFSGQCLLQATGGAVGKNAIVLLFASGGANASASLGTSLLAMTGDVQLLKVENKLLDYADRTVVSVYVQMTGGSSGSIIASAVQLEQKAYATPFVPAKDANGILLPGQAWNGPPDASTSTRNPGVMWIPPSIANGIIDFERGSFYLRAKDAGMPVPSRRPWRWGEVTAGYDSIMAQTYSDQSFSLNFYAGTTASNAYGGIVVPASPYTAYGEWDGNNAKVAINGSFGSIGTRSSRVGVKPTSDMYIGAGLPTAQQYDGSIVALLFFPRPLTAAELAKLDATPTALLSWDVLADKPGGMLRVGKPGPSILTVGGNPLSILGGA